PSALSAGPNASAGTGAKSGKLSAFAALAVLASGPPSSAAAVGPRAAAAAAVRKVRRLVPGASECAAILDAFWKGLSLRLADVVFSAMGQVAPVLIACELGRRC